MLTDENKNQLRAQLEQLRQEIMTTRNRELQETADISAEAYEEHSLGNHMADEATDLHEQELTTGFREDDDLRLQQIEHALQLMDTGKYGFDEETGEEIPLERLQVLPYATRTVKNQANWDAEDTSEPDSDILMQDREVQNDNSNRSLTS